MEKFPPGSILQFTYGEYSDFHNCGTFVTLKEVDLEECAKAFILDAYKTKKEWEPIEVDVDDFPSFLVKTEQAMPIDLTEVHIGTYGELRIGSFSCDIYDWNANPLKKDEEDNFNG